MQTIRVNWTTRYLNNAGFVSACTGLISFWLLILAFREDTPEIKLYLAVAGLLGTFISYAIAKDIMDRVRNHEVDADSISNHQTRLAYIGTRFGFALSNLILLVALASVVLFSLPLIERIAALCPSDSSVGSCLYYFTGIPSE